MVSEFPDSPMGHFSLGKYFLEKGRFAESASALQKAVELDAGYAAAWVALGDAKAASGDTAGAKLAWQKALDTPHGKKDLSLQSDLEQRMQELT